MVRFQTTVKQSLKYFRILMKNYLAILLLLVGLGTSAQTSMNLDSLFNWQDPSLVPSNAHFNTYNEIWGYASNNKEYAKIGTTEGTHIFDVTNPEMSEQVELVVGKVTGTSIIHRDFHDYDDYLYIVCDEGASSLQIADLRFLPDSAPVVYDSDALFPRSHNIFIDSVSARMYVCGGTVDFAVYSLEDPTDPTLLVDCPSELPFWTAIGYVHDVFVRGDTAYLNAGPRGLFVVDFSDLNSIQMIGSLDTYVQKGYNHSGWLMDDKPYYALADETHGTDVKLIDMSDMSDLTVVDTIGANVNQFSIPHNVVFRDNFLFIAHYFDGLYMFDCSDPTNPVLAGFYDTSSESHQNGWYRGCWGVYPFLPSGNILASDMQTGLWVFRSSLISGVSEVSTADSDFEVYPNPTTGLLNFTKPFAEAEYSIVDMQGKQVLNGHCNGTVDVSGIRSGLYSILLSTKEERYRKRFLKQ